MQSSEADGPTLIWERPEPPSRPTPKPLSRAAIVRAAIELADEDGLGAVSLRKVGAALDAGPMRLYGYLSTKEELLDLMLDEVYGEIVPTEPASGDWRADLRMLAHRLRAAACRHEWFVDLVGGRPSLGPNALAYLEATMSTLDGVPGFERIDSVLRAVDAVSGFVVGAVRGEITERRAEHASGLTEQQWQAASGPYLARLLETGRYPSLAKAVHEATDPAPDVAFDAALDYILDGIATRIPG